MRVDPLKLRSAIGTNLAPVSYYSSQLPFVDVMKSASPWISGSSGGTWDTQQPLNLDANGWVRSLAPGQVARTLMLRAIPNHYPAGRYLVRYKGQGTIKIDYAARVVSQIPGEIVIDVNPGADDGGVYLGIEATNPNDYVRDIVVTMPGGICEDDPFTHAASAQACGSRRFLSYADNSDTIIFNPAFLSRLRSYSVLRFMDWMATNNAQISAWSQRTPVTYQNWGVVPLEVMIELCNRLGAHPWFTIYHLVDDSFVNAFAQIVKAKLNPALRVYVEHSNEVWNWSFTQAAYAESKGRAMNPPTNFNGYHAFRTREIGNIFKTVIGAGRVVTVLGAQGGSRAITYSIPEVIAKYGRHDYDAIAIAPYFGITPNSAEASTYTAMTVDQLYAYARATVMPQAQAIIDMHAQIATTFGVKLLAYEGGQHLNGIRGAENNDQLAGLFIAFNRDPRIKQLYLDYLAGWKRAGGQAFVHYYDVGKFSKWGSWGALETIDQTRPAAPKFDAIQSFIEQNPVWWPQ